MSARLTFAVALLASATTPALSLAARGRPSAPIRTRALLLRAEDRRDVAEPALRRAMGSGSATLRARAARALGRIGDDDALSLLLPALEDPDAAVRREAAFALGEVESPRAAPALRAGLADEDLETRVRSAEALSKLEWPTPEERSAAGAEVSLLIGELSANRSAAEPLARLLGHAWRFGRDAPGLARQVDLLASRAGPVGVAATYCGARLADPRLFTAFRSAVLSEAPERVAAGARGLAAVVGSIAPDRVQESRGLLMAAARGAARGAARSSVTARVAALRALARFPRPEEAEAAALVRAGLSSGSHQVQRAALALARAWPVRSLEDELERLVVAPGDRLDLAADAAVALAATSGDEAASALEAAAADPRWRMRAAVAGALSAERASKGRLRQIQDRLLLDADPRVLASALESALASGRADATVLALGHLGASDVVVRAVAASALADLVGDQLRIEEAVRALRRTFAEALRDPGLDARVAALEGLVELLGPAAAPDIAAALDLTSPADHPVRLRARELARQRGLAELAAKPLRPAAPDRPLAWYLEAAEQEARGEPVRWRLATERGDLDLELHPEQAVMTVRHLTRLARAGYFDGISFHRVVPDFVVQGGDPRGDGWGGPTGAVRCEINDLRYERGTVGMALAGKDTGGSQFFLTHSAQPHLDGGYTAFGRVLPASLDVMDALRRFDEIRHVTVLSGAGPGDGGGAAW